MNEIKFCPMIKTYCKKRKCSWYDETIGKCGISEIADSLGWLISRAEDRGINVNVISMGEDND